MATKTIEEMRLAAISDRRALIPYQNVMESDTLNLGRLCIFILDNNTSRRDYIDHEVG
jgi:hypothetical protein